MTRVDAPQRSWTIGMTVAVLVSVIACPFRMGEGRPVLPLGRRHKGKWRWTRGTVCERGAVHASSGASDGAGGR